MKNFQRVNLKRLIEGETIPWLKGKGHAKMIYKTRD
jgi:hypothetical protein